ncbi:MULTISPECIES: hypothetical protein [Nocardia]|uniref:hypothetical protein n=1 Tax=Nocardia TaxID=1817 RepID=UPI0007A4C618|nr:MULTISPECIES: hypothetical protein [Nocardia]
MALDENQLYRDIRDLFESNVSFTEATVTASQLVNHLKTLRPEWFEQPTILPQQFIQARLAEETQYSGTKFEKVTQAVIKRYVDIVSRLEAQVDIRRDLRLLPGLHETLKIIAEQWKAHPDYERIDWP